MGTGSQLFLIRKILGIINRNLQVYRVPEVLIELNQILEDEGHNIHVVYEAEGLHAYPKKNRSTWY